MKIRKFTSLLAMMLVGAASSMAQLSWVHYQTQYYDDSTPPELILEDPIVLADGETLTVNNEATTFTTGFYIGISNESSNAINCTISKSNVTSDSGLDMLGMCIGQNCLPPTTTSTEYTIAGNTVDSHAFHVQWLMPTGQTSGTFTIKGGFYSATLNLVFICDDDPSNNGVTIGSGSSVNDIAAKECSASLQNGMLTIAGASAGQQIRVIDLTGRVAATFAVANDGTQRYDLGLGKGIYLVAIQEHGRTQDVQKVIAR